MALNISLHLLLSPLIYILLLPPSSPPPRAWLSSSPVFTPPYGSIIQPILSKELSRSGSVFFWELPSLTVIADVFLLLLHLQQQGDIYNTCYHSILLDTFYSRLSNFKTDSAHSLALLNLNNMRMVKKLMKSDLVAKQIHLQMLLFQIPNCRMIIIIKRNIKKL